MIQVKIQLGKDQFDAGGDTLVLNGLRCQSSILSYEGGTTPAVSQLQLRVYGMLGSDMAKLSTLGFSYGTYVKNLIEVSAGDGPDSMSVVFSGGITNASVNYNDMPDVGVDILAFAGYTQKMESAQPTANKGTVDVADMLKAIATTAGLTFVNNGVTAKLSNQSSAQTAHDQIADICYAANVKWHIDGKTLSIWPLGGRKDDTIINLDAQHGMVGYPMYNVGGIDVVSLFNPDIQVGRRVKVKTSVPNLNPQAQQQIAIAANPQNVPSTIPGDDGTYFIFSVSHDLESESPNGRWFTRASAGFFQTVARAPQ